MPAVLPIAAVLLALLALLVYYGAEKLGQALVQLVPNWSIPAVGNLRSGVAAVVNAGIAAVQAVVRPAVNPALSLFTTVGVWALRMFGDVIDGLPAVAGALHRLFVNVIPGMLATVRNWALRQIVNAVGIVTRAVDALRAGAYAAITAARAYARTLVNVTAGLLNQAVTALRVNVFAALNVARGEARDLVHGLDRAVTAEFGQLRSWAVQGFAAAEHELSVAVTGLETELGHAVTAAEQFAGAAAATAAGKVQSVVIGAVTSVAGTIDTLVTDDVHALEGVLATDFPDIRALLGELDLAQAGSLAGVLGISAVMDRVLARYLRDCGIPNCRNLGGLGTFLRDLLGAGSLAALLAMLAQMIDDPEAAAHATRTELAAPLNLAKSLAHDLLGV